MAPLARKAQARCLILEEMAATSDTFSSQSATLQQPLPDTGERRITSLSIDVLGQPKQIGSADWFCNHLLQTLP